MLAISFDYSLYEKMFPHPNQKVSWMMGRVQLLGILREMGVINADKPHHLLQTKNFDFFTLLKMILQFGASLFAVTMLFAFTEYYYS